MRLKDFLHLDCLTVTGKPLKKNIRRIKVLDDKIIRLLNNPVFTQGGIVILRGNLAPDGAVVKQSAISNKSMLRCEGPARVYNSEKDAINALSKHEIENGDIIVIRYEGPKGGPGMPELVAMTANLMLRKDMDEVALITDGRFSGATEGPCIGHISPEAYVGGTIAIIENGDLIQIDIPNRKIHLKLGEREIKTRFQDWTPYEKEITSKTLLKYRALVTSADKGAVLKI
jgi:dihydroxy-acid dehydratase